MVKGIKNTSFEEVNLHERLELMLIYYPEHDSIHFIGYIIIDNENSHEMSCPGSGRMAAFHSTTPDIVNCPKRSATRSNRRRCASQHFEKKVYLSRF